MPIRTERVRALTESFTRILGRGLRQAIFLVPVILLGGLSPAIASENEDELIAFDIEAGPATRSLNEYARQANIQLGFSTDDIGAIQTNALKGRFNTHEALIRLLKNTGLVVKGEGNGFLVLYPQAPAIAASGEKRADTTEIDRAARPTEDNAHAGNEGNPLEEIVVTGSNIRGAGGAGASTISFDRQHLEKTGFATVDEFFQSLPQNLDEITPIGSIASGTSELAGFNTHGSFGINLRGLGPGSTLVLLNGKRRAGNINGRVVDVSAIPLAMVDRIELVTGGYSAVYGSDAVAGVVNIVTRKELDGAETQLYYGGSSVGGDRLNFSQAFGQDFGRAGFAVGYDYRDDRALDATDTGVLHLTATTSLTPIESLFHIRGIGKQHTGTFTGYFEVNGNIELYADAHLSIDEYQHQLAYRVAGCCDVDTHAVVDAEQYSATAGSRVDLGSDWIVDLSATKGLVENKEAAGTAVTLPVGQVTAADPRPDPTKEDHDRAELASFSATADGPLWELGGVSLSAAVGVALRDESYRNASTNFTTGATEVFEDIDRDVRSVFGELYLPISTGHGQRFEVSIAGRYDKYSDFGSTFNPQVGLEWNPWKEVTLRGSYSKAFRAPTLFELATEPRVRIATVTDPTNSTGATDATLFIRSGGNPGLDPEKADTYTVGVDWAPTDLSKVSITFFDINYDGRIDTPDPFSSGFAALENESLYEGLIDRSPSPAGIDAILEGAELIINSSGVPFDPASQDPFEVYQNIVVFDNRANNISLDSMAGFDLQMSTSWETAHGNWSLGLNGVYYLDYERDITPTSPTISQLNKPGRQVDLRLRGHVGWSRLAWNTELYINYINSYKDDLADPARPMASWTTMDFTVGFDASVVSDSPVAGGLRASLSIINLLDEPPPVLTSNSFGLGYDAVNADPMGRFISLRLSKRW